MVCNDARVLELLKHFVPTADDCNRYSTVPGQGIFPRKEALEYHLLESAMLQTGYRDSMKGQAGGYWHVQGIYVITPSGKVIAGSHHPLNVAVNLNSIRKGLEAYAKMPREERLLSRAPDPKKDRMFPESEPPRPPVDGLVLRVVGRGLKENIDDRCELNPKYYSIDRLWYTREEALQFLPDTLRAGQQKELTGPVLNGLAQLYLVAGQSQFYDNEVKGLRLTTEVMAIEGSAVKLKLSGHAVLEATHKFNPSKYYPDLLGYLTYDTQKHGFTQFELLAYGIRSYGDNAMRKDGPDNIPMAFLFTLNGSNVNDNQAPTKLGIYRFVKLKAGNKGGAAVR